MWWRSSSTSMTRCMREMLLQRFVCFQGGHLYFVGLEHGLDTLKGDHKWRHTVWPENLRDWANFSFCRLFMAVLFYFFIYFTTVLSHADFSHRKFGLFSLGKASRKSCYPTCMWLHMQVYGHCMVCERVCAESWLWEKFPCHTRESNLPQLPASPTLYHLSYILTQTLSLFMQQKYCFLVFFFCLPSDIDVWKIDWLLMFILFLFFYTSTIA